MVQLLKYPTKEEAAKQIALHIATKINSFAPTKSKPFVLGLPTGSSPEPVYDELIRLYKSGKVSFKNVVTFNMDEYCGLEPTNDQSYHYFMYKKFFNHIDIERKNIHILNGLADDPQKECKLYEKEIAKFAPFHIFLGGIGPKGHIAFNESGSTRDSITRKVELDKSTIKANCRFFNFDESKVPKAALSVGISTVLDNSEEIIILVFGGSKSEILNKTLNDPISSIIPSTFLREHKSCLICCDEEAVIGFGL
jgi:glucosamine-6-phosphate deaminase